MSLVRAVIVDDNPEDRGFLADLLRSSGVREIHEFSDVHAGFAHIVENSAELVFLDYRLETDFGIAHIPRIKAAQPNAKIFLVTGLSRPGIETALAKVGVVFLDKDNLKGETIRIHLTETVKAFGGTKAD